MTGNKTSHSSTNPRPEKMTKGWRGDLYAESILLDSKSMLLCYNKSTKGLEVHESIVSNGITYVPLEKGDWGYIPYSFSSDELNHLISAEISKEEILDEVAQQVEIYMSATAEIKSLVIGDTLLTYCLEWISTLHYPFFVGETESGKSTALHLAKWLCYRCHLGEDIPTADVYNFLGKDDEGLGTIAEDEAQEIWRNSEKIRMYKGGYAKGSKKARVMGVDSLNKHQVYYNTFGPKWFAGEKLPFDKGFRERSPVCHMIQGKSQKNIKRIGDDEKRILENLRNKMLVWKVKNIEVGLTSILSGLENRDQELWEDYLKVMANTKYEQQGKKTVEYFVKQRHGNIEDSLEARIFHSLIVFLDGNNEVYMEEFWRKLIHIESPIQGELYGESYLEHDTGQKITRNLLSKMFEEKWKAIKSSTIGHDENKRQRKRTFYVFDREILSSLTKKYGIDKDSKTK